MGKLIISGDAADTAQAFVDQWNDDRTYICAHTSGSTGEPKPIELLKDDMRVSAAKTCEYFGIDNNSLLGLPLSMNYIAGKMMVVRALMSGASLWLEIPSTAPLSGYDSDRRIDLLSVVPAQIPGLLKSEKMPMVKHLLIGGAPLSVEAESQLLLAGVSAYCSYGMTETCSHIALRKIGSPYYSALDGVTFSGDERNCLVIKSEDFSFKQLVTNDVVRLISNHCFEWLGRVDNVINSGGIKIHPEVMERKISCCMAGVAFYVTSRPSTRWGEEIVLVVESEKPLPHLKEKISKVLTRYENPKEIVYRKELKRTLSGKLKREPIQ